MNSKLFSLIFFFTLLRLLVAISNGLGVDEAHYALYGLLPALSYFDHPPLVGWLQIPFVPWPMPWSLKARLPALLAGVFSSLFTYQWLIRKEFSKFQALWGVAALNLCLLFEALTLFFLPDSLLLVLVPALAIVVHDLEIQKSTKNWLKLGLLLGLCGLAKYTSFLFVGALAIRWIQKKYFRDFLQPGLYLGALLAALLISPVLIWNAQHDWMSFKYQTGHVMSWQSLDLRAFIGSQASQLLGLGFFYGWLLKLALHRTAWEFERILIFLCLGFMSFFALFGNFLPHWTAPAFVLGIPWGVAKALEQKYFTRTLKFAFLFSSLFFLGLNLELITHALPASMTRLIYRDLQGWEIYVGKISDEAHFEQKNLAVINWTFGSRFSLFSEHRSEVFVLDQRTDQFDLWNPISPVGKDFWIVLEADRKAEFISQIQCQKIKELGPRPITWRGEDLVNFEVIECSQFAWK